VKKKHLFRHLWEDNIEMDLTENVVKMWVGCDGSS
jgi:hypothetical protein